MILEIKVGDILQMKKKHPCGEDCFTVLRTGSDVRIKCNRCGRDLTLPRVKVESAVKKRISKEDG